MTADNIAEYPTIYALSSGRGTAGLAVLRLSGLRAFDLLDALTPGRERPPPRQLVRRDFLAPGDGEMLDRGMAVIFPTPASYTGEDVLELHVHGGRAVVDAMLTACGAHAGLRMAEPGEFTRRAFQNGRLDLLAAEAVNDLIQAETSMQRRQAVGQLKGNLGQIYETWRDRLVEMLAHVEAEIDFADEDLGEAPINAIRPKLRQLRRDMAGHLDDKERGERLREGVSIAIVGAPNVGKSSLLNALAKRDVAIVSETAGTTRDVIEVHLDLAGFPVILADTAGLRETADQIEDEGVRRGARAGGTGGSENSHGTGRCACLIAAAGRICRRRRYGAGPEHDRPGASCGRAGWRPIFVVGENRPGHG